MAFPAGQRIRASDLNRLGNLVARNSRTTNFATTSAAAPGVRCISTVAGIVAGRTYLWRFRTHFRHTVANATAIVDIRYTTDNTEPVTGSALLTQGLTTLGVANTSNLIETSALYDASITGTLRVAAFVYSGTAGTTTVAVNGTNPCELSIADVGDTIASTGTIY